MSARCMTELTASSSDAPAPRAPWMFTSACRVSAWMPPWTTCRSQGPAPWPCDEDEGHSNHDTWGRVKTDARPRLIRTAMVADGEPRRDHARAVLTAAPSPKPYSPYWAWSRRSSRVCSSMKSFGAWRTARSGGAARRKGRARVRRYLSIPNRPRRMCWNLNRRGFTSVAPPELTSTMRAAIGAYAARGAVVPLATRIFCRSG